jgi:hypothetical protein
MDTKNKNPENPFTEVYGYFQTLLTNLTKEFIGQRYRIVQHIEFENQLKANASISMQIYWTEILMRAHLAATTSLMRTKDWLDGCFNAYEKANYLSFAANLRGLLEATADTCYALKPVPVTLVENFTQIVDHLSAPKRLQQLIISKELEDRLIHFYFARRLPKNSNEPDSHKYKTNSDYIASIQGAKTGYVFDLYSELCELSHPAMASLDYLVHNINAQDFEIHGDDGISFIERLCKKNTKSLIQMTAGINISLLVLRILNEFPISSLYTSSNIIAQGDIPGWKNIEASITKQRL